MAETFSALSAQRGGIVFHYNSRDCQLFLSHFHIHFSVGLRLMPPFTRTWSAGECQSPN